MNKNFLIVFFLVSSCFMVSCNNRSESYVSNLESFNSLAGDNALFDGQAFYNRIIIDYYEQRLSNENFYNMYLSKFEDKLSIKSIENINFIKINSKSNSSAFFIDMAGYNIPSFAGNVFYYSFEGEEYNYHRNCPFDIYYNGTFYYLNDAYLMGIITKDDISFAFDYIKNNYDELELYKYQKDINPSKRNNEYSISQRTKLDSVKEDYYELVIKNDERCQRNSISLNDIHIYQIFAEINDVFSMSFSVDRITKTKYLISPIEKTWEEPLIVSNKNVEPFQEYYPVVWVNKSFYSIDDAISRRIITEENALELLTEYKESSKHENGFLLAN